MSSLPEMERRFYPDPSLSDFQILFGLQIIIRVKKQIKQLRGEE